MHESSKTVDLTGHVSQMSAGLKDQYRYSANFDEGSEDNPNEVVHGNNQDSSQNKRFFNLTRTLGIDRTYSMAEQF